MGSKNDVGAYTFAVGGFILVIIAFIWMLPYAANIGGLDNSTINYLVSTSIALGSALPLAAIIIFLAMLISLRR